MLRFKVICVLLVVFGVVSTFVAGGLPNQEASAQDPTGTVSSPTPPSAPPGTPTGLHAFPTSSPGSVVLRWDSPAEPVVHIVYAVRLDGTDGRYWITRGNTSEVTMDGLEFGQAYWITAIAGRPVANTGRYVWSNWSNWYQATPSFPLPPPLPSSTQTVGTATSSTPTSSASPASDRYVEIKGSVTSINSNAGTFVVRITYHEYFGSVTPPSTITVDYNRLRNVGNWLQVGWYIEAEGDYSASSNTLYAREIERESSDDYEDSHDDDDRYEYDDEYEDDDDGYDDDDDRYDD